MIKLIIALIFTMNLFNYETQKYSVILNDDDFEIRYYEPAIKASVTSDENSNNNFYKLFQFISGNNSKNEKIEMTTPVYMKGEDEKNKMEFVMPSKFNMDNISTPNDTSISIYETQAKYFACIRYGGYSNSSKFQEHSEILLKKLRDMDIKMIGDIFYVSYNSPYKVFNRRNEAMVEIEYVEKN